MRIQNTIGTAACALLVLACAAARAGDTPADYSHAMGLTVSTRNAVVQLRLPKDVYLHARSATLDDVRIFDASGKALPYALVQPAAQTQASRRQLPVKLFPVAASAGDVRDDIEVRTSADGAVTSVTTRHSAAGQQARHDDAPAALVLDVGRSGAAIDALVFTLPEGVDNYEGQVQLEVSDDLRRWDTVGYASLSWFLNREHDTLRNNRMEFEPRAFRYARLSWRQGKPVAFATIVAEAPESIATPPVFDSVTLKPRDGLFPNDLVYDAAPAIPVRRMNLLFAEQNVVLPALVGTYVEAPNLKGVKAIAPSFVPRLQATFFKISQNGQQRNSGELDLPDLHAQAWVLRPQEATSARPEMKLSWAPTAMVFMASGAAPYTLRFGRSNATPGQRDVSQVAPGFTARELQALEQAVPGALTLNSAAAAADDHGPARLRIIALWSVLLLGVGVLGFMAWRLLGQMKEPG